MTFKKQSNGRTATKILAPLFLVLLTFFAYFPGLSGPWTMDDRIIFDNLSFNSLKDFAGSRRLSLFSFYLNESLLPFEALYFRVVNVIIHILNAILLYLLVTRTFALHKIQCISHNTKDDDSSIKLIALFAGFVFALHPININAVTYIVQRMTAMATLFTLSALHLYVTSAVTDKPAKKYLLYTASVICILFGIASKENAVMAVPLILLYDLYFISRFDLRKYFTKVAIVIVLTLILLFTMPNLTSLTAMFREVMLTLSNINQPIPKAGWTAIDVSWTPLQHILTEFRVVCRYLIVILIPVPSLLVFDWSGFELSYDILHPFTTLIALISVSMAFLVAVIKARQWIYISFGLLWYLIAISLESFVAIGSDLYFEHRNYLPLTGLLLGVSLQTISYFQPAKIKRNILLSLICLVALILCGATFIRNQTLSSPITLWTDTVNKTPNNLRAMFGLAESYMSIDDLDSAEGLYQRIYNHSLVDKTPYRAMSAFKLGKIYVMKNRQDLVEKTIEDLKAKGALAKAMVLEGFYNLYKNDYDRIIASLTQYQGYMDEEELLTSLNLLAEASLATKQEDVAFDYYKKALLINRGHTDSLIGIAMLYLKKGDLDTSEQYLKRASSVDSWNCSVFAGLTKFWLIKRDLTRAERFYQKAVATNSNSYNTAIAMAGISLYRGEIIQFGYYYRKALQMGARRPALDRYLGDIEKARKLK